MTNKFKTSNIFHLCDFMWVLDYHYHYFNRAYDLSFEGIAFLRKNIANSLK